MLLVIFNSNVSLFVKKNLNITIYICMYNEYKQCGFGSYQPFGSYWQNPKSWGSVILNRILIQMNQIRITDIHYKPKTHSINILIIIHFNNVIINHSTERIEQLDNNNKAIKHCSFTTISWEVLFTNFSKLQQSGYLIYHVWRSK